MILYTSKGGCASLTTVTTGDGESKETGRWDYIAPRLICPHRSSFFQWTVVTRAHRQLGSTPRLDLLHWCLFLQTRDSRCCNPVGVPPNGNDRGFRCQPFSGPYLSLCFPAQQKFAARMWSHSIFVRWEVQVCCCEVASTTLDAVATKSRGASIHFEQDTASQSSYSNEWCYFI